MLSQAHVRCFTSTWVCEACFVVASWDKKMIMPVPGIAMGADKKRPPNWRSYSTLYEAGVFFSPQRKKCDARIACLSKSIANKQVIAAWLRAPKTGTWFAALSDTGRKHVLPWAPINTATSGNGLVWFEDRRVAIGDWQMVNDMSRLLTAMRDGGAFTDDLAKEEIGSGQYEVESIISTEPLIDAFEAMWAQHRASSWWELALWLCGDAKSTQRPKKRKKTKAKKKTKKTDFES
jgi:hypothetical protein